MCIVKLQWQRLSSLQLGILFFCVSVYPSGYCFVRFHSNIVVIMKCLAIVGQLNLNLSSRRIQTSGDDSDSGDDETSADNDDVGYSLSEASDEDEGGDNSDCSNNGDDRNHVETRQPSSTANEPLLEKQKFRRRKKRPTAERLAQIQKEEVHHLAKLLRCCCM